MNCRNNIQNRRSSPSSAKRAYSLIECLVYIGVLFVLMGVAYIALFRCIANSVALRRNADDISRVLHIGERWRADVRSVTGNIRLQTTNLVQIASLPTPQGQIIYCFATNTVSRSYHGGPWGQLLTNVASSTMSADARRTLTAWKWELELVPKRNSSRIHPLFTFEALPETTVPK
jgi:hypothetical protein